MKVELESRPKAKISASQKISAVYTKLRAEEGAKFGIVVWGILFLAAVAYLSLAYNWPKFSRAEVFFAECVREMFEADNFVTPLYHGTPFFDKPILVYWFIASSYVIGGISHFTARIPSIVMALGTVFLTALAGRNLYGARSGAMAAAVLASSLMFISFSNLCMSDMSLVFFDTLSLILLYASMQEEKKRSVLLYWASLSMGLAFLVKGPVGIVLPGVSFAAYLTITKQWNKIQLLRHLLPCALILAGAGIPWFMAAYRQNGAGALSYFFIHENLERFAGSTYDTHRPIWFMVVSLFSGMLPWSVFIPFCAADFWKTLRLTNNANKPSSACDTGVATTGAATDVRGASRAPVANAESIEIRNKQIYLWLWTAVVIGFFSCSRGKIDYYALPVYPAMAILIGSYLTRACDQKTTVATFFSWLASAVFVIAGAGAFFFLPKLFSGQDFTAWISLPCVLLVCGAIMFYCNKIEDLRKAYKMLCVSICLVAISFSFQFYPWISSKQAVLKYIPYIRNLSESGRVGVYTSLQNWIDEVAFQTGKEPMRIDSVKMAEQFMKAKLPCLLLIQEKEFEQMSPESKQSMRVIARNPFIPRSLNPVYFASKAATLGKQAQLLLVSNQ